MHRPWCKAKTTRPRRRANTPVLLSSPSHDVTSRAQCTWWSIGCMSCLQKRLTTSPPHSRRPTPSLFFSTPQNKKKSTEVFNYQPYNAKVDIYSWAILSWEMLAVDKPFAGVVEKTFRTVRYARRCWVCRRRALIPTRRVVGKC